MARICAILPTQQGMARDRLPGWRRSAMGVPETRVRRPPEAAIGVGLWLVFLLWLAWFHGTELADLKPAIYWAQVLSGNWSPDKRQDLDQYGGDFHFILGTFVAIIINFITLGALIKLTYEYTVGPWSRKVATTLKAALRSRDVAAESSVLESIERTLASLDVNAKDIELVKSNAHRAFNDSVKQWNETGLDNVFGEDRASKVRQYLKSIF